MAEKPKRGRNIVHASSLAEEGVRSLYEAGVVLYVFLDRAYGMPKDPILLTVSCAW